MIELLISLFSAAGSAGLGSVLKLVAGALAGRRENKLATIAATNGTAVAFQSIFGTGENAMSKESAMTRRIIAIMLVGTMCAIGILCVLDPAKDFVTCLMPEMKDGFSLLFGIIKFPSSKEVTVTLTMGHLALTFMNIGALSVGFYFTPGGRR